MLELEGWSTLLLMIGTGSLTMAAGQAELSKQAPCAERVLALPLDAGVPGPTLWTPDGPPVIGGPFSMQVRGGAPGAVGVLFISDSDSPQRPWGVTGKVFVGPPLKRVPFVLNAQGESPILVPSGSIGHGRCGTERLAQAFVRDSADSASVLPSNGLQLRVGVPGVPLLAGAKFPAGTWPTAVALGDLDGDGVLDAAVTDVFADVVSVLIGRPDGSFGPPVGYPVESRPLSIALADLDGDGALDAVIGNHESYTVSVLLGNGDGSLQTAVSYAAGGEPAELAVSDFDGDGSLDLAVANSAGPLGVSVLLGDGDGTFGAATYFPIPRSPWDIVAVDVDADTIPDLALSARFDDEVVLLYGAGDGTFGAPVYVPVPTDMRDLVVQDVTGDGLVDIATAHGGASKKQFNVLPATAPGVFGSPQIYPTQRLQMLAAGDFNGDAVTDLAATTDAFGGELAVLLGDGNGAFVWPPTLFSGGLSASPLEVADLNADGTPELILSNQPSGDLTVLFGQGDGSFVTATDYDTGNGPTAVALDDLNGDGAVDLVIGNKFDWWTEVRLGNGDGTFGASSLATGGGPVTAVVTGRVDGDEHADLVVCMGSPTNRVSVFLGTGLGTFFSSAQFDLGEDPRSLVLSDLNRDGPVDLVVAYSDATVPGDDVRVFLGNGDGSFQAPSTWSTGADAVAVVAEDFDEDGVPDLAVAHRGSDDVSILLGLGDGTFGAPSSAAVGVDPSALAAGDLDADGVLDLLVAGFTSDDVSVLLGRGDGTFEAPVSYPAGVHPVTNPSALVLVDADGNGTLDVLVAGESAFGVALLLGRGDGALLPATVYEAGRTPRALATADLDGNGTPDVVTANHDSDDATVILNRVGF